jgi:hypothetical protein
MGFELAEVDLQFDVWFWTCYLVALLLVSGFSGVYLKFLEFEVGAAI